MEWDPLKWLRELIALMAMDISPAGTRVGLNLVEFSLTRLDSENFSNITCVGQMRDQITALRGGSDVKILSSSAIKGTVPRKSTDVGFIC